MAPTYDKKCAELARSFLSDYPGCDTDDHIDELAGMIQDVIDDYMEQFD